MFWILFFVYSLDLFCKEKEEFYLLHEALEKTNIYPVDYDKSPNIGKQVGFILPYKKHSNYKRAYYFDYSIINGNRRECEAVVSIKDKKLFQEVVISPEKGSWTGYFSFPPVKATVKYESEKCVGEVYLTAYSEANKKKPIDSIFRTPDFKLIMNPSNKNGSLEIEKNIGLLRRIIKADNDRILGKVVHCTVFYVGNNRFLSARHCFPNNVGEMESKYYDSQVDLLMGYTEYGGELSEMNLINVDNVFLHSELDIAVIIVKNSKFLNDLKPLKLARNSFPVDAKTPVYIIQHVFGKQKVLVEDDCFILGVTNDPVLNGEKSYFHECDTERVSSGSPILNSENEVVAIHYRGKNDYFKDKKNRALASEDILEFLQLLQDQAGQVDTP